MLFFLFRMRFSRMFTLFRPVIAVLIMGVFCQVGRHMAGPGKFFSCSSEIRTIKTAVKINIGACEKAVSNQSARISKEQLDQVALLRGMARNRLERLLDLHRKAKATGDQESQNEICASH